MNEVTIRILRVDRKELGEFRLQNIELFFKDMDMVVPELSTYLAYVLKCAGLRSLQGDGIFECVVRNVKRFLPMTTDV